MHQEGGHVINRVVSTLSVLGAVVCLLLPAPVAAQRGQGAAPKVPLAGGCPGEPVPFYHCAIEKAKTYSPPRTSFGQPDLSGYWAHGRQNFDLEDHGETYDMRAETTAIVDPADGKIPYLPWAAAKRDDLRVHRSDPPALEYLNPNTQCFLRGAVPQTYPPFPLQIVQTATHVAILQEQNHAYEIVPVDGRPHVGPNLKLWMGDSRGHWEGNTLVVETVNLIARKVAAGRNWLDQNGDFYTENVRQIQRFIPVDADTLIYEATIIDPTVFTQPWTLAMPLRREKDKNFTLLEFACHEGNKAVGLSLR
jgi:hypothetical protein